MVTSRRNLEGLGGPISHTSQGSTWVDPTLEACCAREIVQNREADAVEATLREHDRVAAAENEARRFRNLVSMPWGDVCRCSYDVEKDGGEYWELMQARKERATAHGADDGEGQEDSGP
eukprot:CAMPEP_0194288654 /NCGR_PEP_ID=MMETSP0169-20130528/37287_1 /TAXON_ID=218684 /ORGANISM="Corethron pennatum, Strain L29A3" /LENGTH=118 /DNA_ID=CAMNT_0039035713 /DNA_START=13 /DNA_END=365 /DNA_ORIENTATION=+